MRCLPTSILAGRLVCLPLCDSTAETLTCAMLANDQATSRVMVAATMTVDPALALWSAINSLIAEPSTIDDLADWLVDALPDCLVPDVSVDEIATEDDIGGREFDLEQLLDWATTSVREAHRLAAKANGVTDNLSASVGARPEYTRGLLHNATCWAGEEHTESLSKLLGLTRDVTADATSRDSPLPFEVESQISDHWMRASNVADHIFSLAATLSHVAKVETQFAETLQQEKMQALYTLAAGAGHEINNPLGSIAGRAQLLVRDEADPQRRRTLAKINTQAFRAHEMISDMMLFARPPAPVRADVDMATLAAEVVEQLRANAAEQSTVISFTPPDEPIHLFADRSQIAVALRAMCTNSLEALGSGGHVEVTTRYVAQEDAQSAESCGKTIQIEVRDDGPGVAPELHSQLFDPFYSGREAGRGLGFGLSKCWRIITNHGGDVLVNSQTGSGATFTITLPVQDGS